MSRTAALALTVDVEDWPQSTWDHSLPITRRAADNTLRLLDLLTEYNVAITLFVLGKFAECFPEVVRRASRLGHEIASHGYGHIEIFHQTRAEFRQDVLRAKHLLEDLTGQPVIGYRAPDFSIIHSTLWALEILADSGYRYDASIFPIRSRRYGIPQWPAGPHQVVWGAGRALVELPATTLVLAGRRWPVAGGGYHRLLPGRVIEWLVRSGLQRGQPFVAYCHPYELDVAELGSIEPQLPWFTRVHQGWGRPAFQSKLRRLLANFPVIKMADLANVSWPVFDFQTAGFDIMS